ncbi:MAG: hypothetical protein HYR71_01245 [Chloroflexi bacterium]|nr:hypothetical protein [Chloroflexota bacterium]
MNLPTSGSRLANDANRSRPVLSACPAEDPADCNRLRPKNDNSANGMTSNSQTPTRSTLDRLGFNPL